MILFKRLSQLIYPPKCVLCRRVLSKQETDLCHPCRSHAPEFTFSKNNISFVADWVALWYYKEQVRSSLHRFKFYNERSNADAYGRLLAMRLMNEEMTDFDLLTWVPISTWRKFCRGYDQSGLLAKAVGRELGVKPVPLLRKRRHTPPQSGLSAISARKANVLGAYQVRSRWKVAGMRILLVDDIITTGSTVSECARVLLTAGAKEVNCAAVAAKHKG